MRYPLAALILILLASCAGPTTAPAPTAFSKADTNPVTQAPDLRFALIGEVTDVNVWALFDSKGYSYNNYAVRNEYWPRLYHLSIPDRNFEPMAASGMPSAVYDDVNYFTATVALRPDLNWTDSSPFTAEDVAFTVNTALAFRLGFDWHDYYNPDYLDHAEAIDASTVRFFFKQHPNVGVWQYGALQGPIVQKAYWSAKIASAKALLPPSDLISQIERLKAKADDLQQKVNALNLSIASTPMTPDEAKQAQDALKRQQGDLNEANNDLIQAQTDYDSAMNAAREALYALDDNDEPTLGNWMPAGQANGEWINKVNPAHPFGEPKFEKAVYIVYPDETFDVRSSFQNDKINALLSQDGLSMGAINTDFAAVIVSNSTSVAYFLIINPNSSVLVDPTLRRALFCSIDVGYNPLSSFVPEANSSWFAPQSLISCGDEPNMTSKQKAVAMLKASDYSWVTEPFSQNPGQGLASPHAMPFPPQHLLALDLHHLSDFQVAAGMAQRIKEAAQYIGLTVIVDNSSPTDINYAVFSNHQYDMAILGWRVSEYPGYLCEWFGDGNPFGYHSDRLQSACETLDSTSDLDQARQQVFEIQSILAQDLPFIPLYSGIIYDAYRNITYPFDSVPGGLSGVYGAPSLAIPALR